MTVKILKKSDGWMLSIRSPANKLSKYWIRPRLIEVLEIANILQIHVDNLSDLPLTQYIPMGGMHGQSDRRAS